MLAFIVGKRRWELTIKIGVQGRWMKLIWDQWFEQFLKTHQGLILNPCKQSACKQPANNLRMDIVIRD